MIWCWKLFGSILAVQNPFPSNLSVFGWGYTFLGKDWVHRLHLPKMLRLKCQFHNLAEIYLFLLFPQFMHFWIKNQMLSRTIGICFHIDFISITRNVHLERGVLQNYFENSISLSQITILFLYFDQTLSIWLGLQFRQRYSQIKKTEGQTFFWIFLAWHAPETQGIQDVILDLLKVHSWLTYWWKSVQFWWYFHSFHENWDEVLLKIRLQTPTKTIGGAVLIIYLLTNTNIAKI